MVCSLFCLCYWCNLSVFIYISVVHFYYYYCKHSPLHYVILSAWNLTCTLSAQFCCTNYVFCSNSCKIFFSLSLLEGKTGGQLRYHLFCISKLFTSLEWTSEMLGFLCQFSMEVCFCCSYFCCFYFPPKDGHKNIKPPNAIKKNYRVVWHCVFFV